MKKILTVVLLIVIMQGLSGLPELQAQPGWYVGNKAPLQPLHPATRAGLIEVARRLDPMVLRWGR